MPALKDFVLDCVVYLYPSDACARNGERTGGTGFLVGVPSETHSAFAYLYAVTNSHVIREGQASVIRLNSQQGGLSIVRRSPDQWVHHIDGDDLAAIHLGGFDESAVKFFAVDIEHFLTPEIIAKYHVGPGADVFMVSRLMGQDGIQKNQPSVRFGNISMMPMLVEHPRGIKQESFVVESRSLSGHSGSPVFVYDVRKKGEVWLLGVDWGHHRTYEKVREGGTKKPVSEGYVVRSNSGMMNVVPAWKVQDLLNQDEFTMKRKEVDERVANEKAAETTAELDVESHTRNQEESFEDILKRVSRKISEPES